MNIVSDTGFVETGSDLEYLMSFGVNYANRIDNPNATLVSFAYCIFNNDLIFCNTNKLDYGVFGSSNATGYVKGVNYEGSSGLDDLSSINNYYHASGSNPFSDFNDEGALYGSYNVTLTNQNHYAVFDYYNLKYENWGDQYFVVRGENTTFHVDAVEVSFNSTPNTIYFSYGAPYYTMSNSEYERGVGAGYSQGWTEGNQNGYQIGVNSQGGAVGQQQATAFTYIEGAFNVVGSVMSLEVLPNITLGLVWSIPLVFILIMTIFKLVRK